MKKFKKITAVVMSCLVFAAALAGCGKDDGGNSRVKQKNAVEDAINDQINKEKGSDTGEVTEASTAKPAEVITTEEQSTANATTETVTADSQIISSESTADNTVENTTDSTADTSTNTQTSEANNPDSTIEIPELHIDPSTLDYSNVDIDITVMSSDMVYATVYQMVYDPEEYVGKTVRIKGQYFVAYSNNPDNNNFYNYCLVADATACCQQGLEFYCTDGHEVYPDDFPEDGTEVEVVGVFEMYEEEGYVYTRLNYANMDIIS